mgnify:CR=1 FL=1
MNPELTMEQRNGLLVEQQNELDSHHVYRRLSRMMDDEGNRDVLAQMSEDELRHYTFLGELTGEELESFGLKPYPNQLYELSITGGQLSFKEL